MKFLCLAYGAEEDWKKLSKSEQEKLLEQDQVIRDRGAFMAPVERPETVWVANGEVVKSKRPFAKARVPLAGFSLINANSLNEVIDLVSKTPCPNAGGAIEIWPVIAKDGEGK